MNTLHFIHSAVLVFSAVTLSAQVNHSGSVELLDASEDNTQVLFQVDGIATKKGDVALSARETVFYKLFYEGVEGVNDDAPMVTKSKNYYVENFFAKKNPAMNRFVVLEELKGAVNRNVDGQYIGTYELTVNLKALVSALNKAGATEAPVVRTVKLAKRSIGIDAEKKSREASTPPPTTPKPAQDQPATKPAQNQPVSAPAPAAEPTPAKVIVTKSGVGPVKVGQKVSALPKSVPGLYDKLQKSSRVEYEDGDEYTVEVYQGKLGKEVVFEFPAEEKVDDITIYSKHLTTEKGLGLSSMPAALFSAGGTVMEGNDGVRGILCEGVLFVNIPFTSSGNKKAERSYFGETVTFTASDFVAGSHPEKMFIASWL